MIANVPPVDPACTVIDLGTEATAWLLVRFTFKPPAGAGPDRATVPVEVAPPPKLVGFRVSPLRTAGLIVRVAAADDPVIFAMIFATVEAATDRVVIVKVVEVEPAAMETEDGPPQARLDDVRATLMPPLGAADPRLTVPVLVAPPVSELGLNVSEVSFAA